MLDTGLSQKPRERHPPPLLTMLACSLIAICTAFDSAVAVVLDPIPNYTIYEGVVLSLHATATSGSTITFYLGPGAPAGAVITAGSGAFTWTPSCDQGGQTYSITICAADQSSSDCKSFQVTVLRVPPSANPQGPYGGCVGREIQFNGSGFTKCGTISGYEWDFGDGQPHAFTANPRHTYAAGGTYAASLTITTNRIPPTSDMRTVVVTVSTNQWTFDGNAPQLNLNSNNDLDIRFLPGPGGSLSDWDLIASNATLTASGYPATNPATAAVSAEISNAKGHVVFSVNAMKKLLPGFSSQQFTDQSFTLEIVLRNAIGGCNRATITFTAQVKLQ